MKMLKAFLNMGIIFLEVGPGDCALALEAAKYVKKLFAVDVSKEITKGFTSPDNFQLILSDGCSIPLESNSINIAYSHQLMEHLHPDDAFEQLQDIYRVLIPGGFYICITPNKLSGPHDISKYFDQEATGFHLREYTVTDLVKLFKKVGFSKFKFYCGGKGIYFKIPVFPIICYEKILSYIPYKIRKMILSFRLFSAFLNIRLIGYK